MGRWSKMLAEFLEDVDLESLIAAIHETFYMTILALVGTLIIGIVLGVLLYLMAGDGLHQQKVIHFIVAALVNIFWAIPFIILILLLFLFTDLIVGTIRGPTAALPGLILAVAPFYGRLVEIALNEVDKGVVEAAKAMGSST